MDYKNEIADFFNTGLDLPLSRDEILESLEVPKKQDMGDYAFPCFRLAKSLKKAPPLIAQDLAAKIQDLPTFINKIEAAGPYLNIFLNQASLAESLIPQILSNSFTQACKPTGCKTMIEYSQPNTHKGFHVGHTRNVSLGDSLVRLREWLGDDVIAANYIGDVGTHIAKCLWYLKKSGIKYQDYQQNMSRGEFLGMCYAEADKLMDFTSLTKCTQLHTIIVEIKSIAKHPKNNKWQVIEVYDGKQNYSVVTAALGAQVGKKTAFALPGARFGSKTVAACDKEGIESQGMLCTALELNLGEDNQNIFIIEDDATLGAFICDHYQTDKSISSAHDEIMQREKEVSVILQKLEAQEPEMTQLWQETKEWSMQDFYDIYAWLGARFDHYFYESDVAKPGKEVVKDYYEKGVFKKDQGAIGVDLSQYNLPFFLVLKSDGTGLYSTKDLALARLKFEKYNIDRSIYVVDAGQSLHFQQVFKTLDLMGYEQAKNCYHLSYGMVMLPEGKMSSRKGNVILLSQLRDLLAKQIYQDFISQYKETWEESEIKEAIRKISLATIKYGMLNQDSNKNIIFDLKEWTARTGNTGPYLMYAYARTRSILREIEKKYPNVGLKPDWALLQHPSELKLLQKMASFRDICQKAAERYEPQILCIYLYELSKDFSRMYDACSVLHAESDSLRTTRSALVDASGRIIKAGLALLGIESLERM